MFRTAIFTNNKSIKSDAKKGLDVFYWGELHSDINPSDYDGIVFDLEDFDEETVDWFEYQHIFNLDAYRDICSVQNSFVAVFGSPIVGFKGHFGDDTQLLEWTGFRFEGAERSGKTAKITEHGESSIFSKFLKSQDYKFSITKVTSTEEIRNKLKTPNSHVTVNGRVYSQNRSSHTLAGEFWHSRYKGQYSNERIFSGSLYLLPVLGKCKELTDILIAARSTSQQVATPDWVEDVVVYGKKEADKAISDSTKKIEGLKKEHQTLVKEKSDVMEPTKILYYSDKPLEQEVVSTLKKMGINVQSPKESNKVEFLFDHSKTNFAAEVKSTLKEQIDQKGLRQAIDWSNDAYDSTNVEHKPVVFASNQYDIEPKFRSDPLPDNLVDYAKRRNIAVVKIVDLFEFGQKVLEGKARVEDFISVVSQTSGLCQFENRPQPDQRSDKT